MSYDLYCYRPTSNVPNPAEAQAIVEAINEAEETGETSATSGATKERITAALIEHNPRLEPFQFDYGKIAGLQKISEEEARARYKHVELNPPEGDLAIQLTVDHDHVFLAIPYWYKGSKADEVFSQLSGYLEVIANASGFFAYDPQTGIAFDPRRVQLQDHHHYDRVVADLPRIVAPLESHRRPWWRFW